MGSILKNNSEQRFKAGWRILFFLILFWTLSILSIIIKPLFGDITKREFLSNYSVVIVLILAIAATISTTISRKYFDKKSFKSLGLSIQKQSLKDLGFGFVLSGIMAGSFLIISYSLGIVEFNGLNYTSVSQAISSSSSYSQFIQYFSLAFLGIVLFEHILVGYWEELVFRGYLFQNMREGMGLTWSVLISCLIYGLIHSSNPNATILSSIIIAFFGLLRIYGYLVTGMLWLSVGMHIGWNFFQGPIFGFAASGHQHATLFNITINKPYWLSGGEFGPEGSVLIIPILVITFTIMNLWGKNSRKHYSHD